MVPSRDPGQDAFALASGRVLHASPSREGSGCSRATQAELKTPLMPGRQADGAGSAVPDPRAESPDAARAGDPAR